MLQFTVPASLQPGQLFFSHPIFCCDARPRQHIPPIAPHPDKATTPPASHSLSLASPSTFWESIIPRRVIYFLDAAEFELPLLVRLRHVAPLFILLSQTKLDRVLGFHFAVAYVRDSLKTESPHRFYFTFLSLSQLQSTELASSWNPTLRAERSYATVPRPRP